MTFLKRALMLMALVLFLSLGYGCAHKQVSTGESAAVLYENAMKELSKKSGFPYILTGPNYDAVLERLKEIQLRYTYSPYASLAELGMGDFYFLRGEYGQAVASYEEFVKRHPGHRKAPYAMYRLGLSYYKLGKSRDRDPTNMREADKWFDRFMWTYPDSKYYREVSGLSMKTRRRLAEREFYIGDYYKKKKNYGAAAQRYSVVVERYYDTDLVEKALYQVGELYYKMGDYEQAEGPLRRVVREYPTAHYHKRAARLLARIEQHRRKTAANR